MSTVKSFFGQLKGVVYLSMFCISMFFATSASAYYGPIGTPPDNYVRVECHLVEWRIATVFFTSGDQQYLTKTIEICTYYDAKDETVGYSMTIVD